MASENDYVNNNSNLSKTKCGNGSVTAPSISTYSELGSTGKLSSYSTLGLLGYSD